MKPVNPKMSKILNYSIIVGCMILLVLVVFFVSQNGNESLMGNSVYNNKHEIGDIVEYADSKWYVIGLNNKSYTLLKQQSLTKEEIQSLNIGVSVTDKGQIPYDYGYDCNETITEGCSVNLEDSTIGQTLTNWQKRTLNIDDLITVGDYTIRLLDASDIEKLKKFDWLFLDSFCWTMYAPNYSDLNIYGLYPDKNLYVQMVYDGSNDMPGGLVRPVINVSKSVIK